MKPNLPFSLYLHIPYCFHKCPYCDFNTYAVAVPPEDEYVTALLSELDYYSYSPDWRGRKVQTIFFGGGTPSIFSPKSIKKVISAISQLFPVDPLVEVSLEANPGTVTTDSLIGYRLAGVNRLSLGAQSFNPSILRILGRMHTPNQIECAIGAAKVSGFTNISVDLIYGVESQTLEDLRNDLRIVTQNELKHLSAYCLTIEKGTEFFSRYKKGRLKIPSEGLVVEMMEEIAEFLPKYGLARYEISNYSVPGSEARHNLAYWSGDDYLGVGAGAHSFLRRGQVEGLRWANIATPKEYIHAAVSNGKADSWKEDIDYHEAMFEFFFLGLRKTSGVSVVEFEARFGISMETAYPQLIEILTEDHLIAFEDDRIKLTSKGLMVADTVIGNFVPDTEMKKAANV